MSLREHANKMSEGDKEKFAMMLKRDRDDEDLDALALQQLKQFHGRYVAKRTKEELDSQWKKLTGR